MTVAHIWAHPVHFPFGSYNTSFCLCTVVDWNALPVLVRTTKLLALTFLSHSITSICCACLQSDGGEQYRRRLTVPGAAAAAAPQTMTTTTTNTTTTSHHPAAASLAALDPAVFSFRSIWLLGAAPSSAARG